MAQEQARKSGEQYQKGAEDHPGRVSAVRDGHRTLRFCRLRGGHEEEEEEGASEHGTIRQWLVPYVYGVAVNTLIRLVGGWVCGG